MLITRIAPTPSGYVHVGNAVNFVLTDWLARSSGGRLILRIDDFERFVGFFVAAGYDLNAKDAKGNDFIALIQDQRFAEPYIDVINAARS